MLVILSGVAGAGKDTIKKELIKRMENVETLPSFTSRPKREGDVEGGTYYFVTKPEQYNNVFSNACILFYIIKMVIFMNMMYITTITMELQKNY